MTHELKFEVLVLPSAPWAELLQRFKLVEALGFDVVTTGDHFVDWTNPSNPWFEPWTLLAAVARETSTIELATGVAQIPLRHPAMTAHHALGLDHISDGRFRLGLGIGLPIDPSYDMMGIANWSNPERVARFKEYVEIVDQLLSNETTTYKGEYYEINAAVMNPRPIRHPRPPIAIAAFGKRMLGLAARYADVWDSLSFSDDFEQQLKQTSERIKTIDQHCADIGRDPSTLRRSYLMFDANARHSGGAINYYESEERFADMVQGIIALGITEIGLYFPATEAQLPKFEAIAKKVIPQLKADYAAR
jgi:alkanesulfonate monooxygenase SsuD/methylene tetrahydromethanopterin reductase-like flavin-dependent oxidoreductase (luciferase family)